MQYWGVHCLHDPQRDQNLLFGNSTSQFHESARQGSCVLVLIYPKATAVQMTDWEGKWRQLSGPRDQQLLLPNSWVIVLLLSSHLSATVQGKGRRGLATSVAQETKVPPPSFWHWQAPALFWPLVDWMQRIPQSMVTFAALKESGNCFWNSLIALSPTHCRPFVCRRTQKRSGADTRQCKERRKVEKRREMQSKSVMGEIFWQPEEATAQKKVPWSPASPIIHHLLLRFTKQSHS